MMWGGGGGGETAVRSMVKLSREAPETSSIISVLGEMHLVPTNPAERKTMEDITTLLRNPDVKTSDVDKVLHSHLSSLASLSCSHLSVLTMCVSSPDFKAGKARGLSWNLLNSFKTYIEHNNLTEPPPPLTVADEALRRLARQPNPSILRLGCQVFQLELSGVGGRYDQEVELLVREGGYKAACETAVCLQRFHFPLETFCLPLLLMGNTSTMENYLDKSPELQSKLLQFLDRLGAGEFTVSDLIFSYPAVKPSGASKLVSKPLDKLIKKYAARWSLPDSLYPQSKDRWAKVDLSFWVRQMFSSSNNFELELVNWREIVTSKVGEDRLLQEYLVSQVFSYSAAEGNYLAGKFNSKVWCPGGGQGQTEARSGSEQSQSKKSPGKVEADYYQLPFSEEKICLVNTREKFLQFVSGLESLGSVPGHHIGLDAEHFQDKLSLVQISLEEEIFLLDWVDLPSVLEQQDYNALRDKVLLNTNLLIVGFGVIGDMKLLAKSLPGCEDLAQVGRNVLDLERVRGRLCQLLAVEVSQTRGLAGLCHSVLARPLKKTEQISDWSRRPLRSSQITYAALDAFSCWKIYQVLDLRAKELSEERKFLEIVSSQVNKAQADKKTEKAKRSRQEARAELECSVPDLVAPLFTSVRQPGEVRLVCDDMLQGLCRKLRMFGVDCLALENGQDHLDCVSLASGEEGRFVVSRGAAAARIKKRLQPGQCLAITSNDLDLQVEEVFRYFNIQADSTNLFSRCVLCNGDQYYELSQNILARLADKKTKDVVEREGGEETWETVVVTNNHSGEERSGRVSLVSGLTETGVMVQVEKMARATISTYQQFWVCGQCGKVYFEGSHWVAATASAKSLLTNKQ